MVLRPGFPKRRPLLLQEPRSRRRVGAIKSLSVIADPSVESD